MPAGVSSAGARARAELIGKLQPYANWAASLPPTDEAKRLIAAIAKIRRSTETAADSDTLRRTARDMASLRKAQPSRTGSPSL